MIPLTLATVIIMGLGLVSIHASNQKMPKEAKIKAKYLDKARKHSDRFFAPFIDWHKVSSVNGCGKLSNGSINDVVGICVARYRFKFKIALKIFITMHFVGCLFSGILGKY